MVFLLFDTRFLVFVFSVLLLFVTSMLRIASALGYMVKQGQLLVSECQSCLSPILISLFHLSF